MAIANNEPSLLLIFTRSPDMVNREARTQGWPVLLLLLCSHAEWRILRLRATRERVELSHVATRYALRSGCAPVWNRFSTFILYWCSTELRRSDTATLCASRLVIVLLLSRRLPDSGQTAFRLPAFC